MIEACPVRTNKFAGAKMIARHRTQRLPIVCFGIVAKVLDNSIVTVEERDSGAEIGHHCHVAFSIEPEMTRQVGSSDEAQMFAIERKRLDPVVRTIRDHQNRFDPARVADDPVQQLN